MVKDKIFHLGNLSGDACCTFYWFKNQLIPLQVFGLKRFTARVFMVPFRVLNHEIVWQEISVSFTQCLQKMIFVNVQNFWWVPTFFLHESSPGLISSILYHLTTNDIKITIIALSHWLLQGHTTSKRNCFPPKEFNTLLVLQMTLMICNIPTSLPLIALFYFLRNKINYLRNLTAFSSKFESTRASCVAQLEHWLQHAHYRAGTSGWP